MLDRIGHISLYLVSGEFLRVESERQTRINKVGAMILLILILCAADFIYARWQDRAQYKKNMEQWERDRQEERHGEMLPNWYVPPISKPTIVQATIFQGVPVPDITLIGALCTAIGALSGTIAVLFWHYVKTIKAKDERAYKKEDERDENDRENTAVMKSLQITMDRAANQIEVLVRKR